MFIQLTKIAWGLHWIYENEGRIGFHKRRPCEKECLLKYLISIPFPQLKIYIKTDVELASVQRGEASVLRLMFNYFLVFRPFPVVKPPECVNHRAAWVLKRRDCLGNSCLEDRTVQVAGDEKHLQQHFYHGIYLHLYLLVLVRKSVFWLTYLCLLCKLEPH